MKKYLIVILLATSFTSVVFADTTPIKNTGFVQTNIWYSSETFYAGDTVRIYTAIFNGTTADLSGEVEFLDNDILVGKTSFNLLGSGQVSDVSVPWKTTAGKHAITARIIGANISLHGGTRTQIALADAQAGKSEIAVQVDPAIGAAQTQAAVASVTQAGTQAMGTVEKVLQTVGSAIPAPVKEGTTASLGAIENLRTALSAQLLAAKQEKGKEIDALNSPTIASTTVVKEKAKQDTGVISTISKSAEKPFDYVVFAILAALQYFFEWKIIFYSVVLYALYRLVKWGIQKIRNR